jgi:predicted Fe-S protein YdhL (DUF1289 family)
MAVILSPCVRLCAIDPATGLCVGCGRRLAEIANWVGYSDRERRAIIAVLPARLGSIKSPADAEAS